MVGTEIKNPSGEELKETLNRMNLIKTREFIAGWKSFILNGAFNHNQRFKVLSEQIIRSQVNDDWGPGCFVIFNYEKVLVSITHSNGHSETI
jgi:hypothetical protein